MANRPDFTGVRFNHVETGQIVRRLDAGSREYIDDPESREFTGKPWITLAAWNEADLLEVKNLLQENIRFLPGFSIGDVERDTLFTTKSTEGSFRLVVKGSFTPRDKKDDGTKIDGLKMRDEVVLHLADAAAMICDNAGVNPCLFVKAEPEICGPSGYNLVFNIYPDTVAIRNNDVSSLLLRMVQVASENLNIRHFNFDGFDNGVAKIEGQTIYKSEALAETNADDKIRQLFDSLRFNFSQRRMVKGR